MTTLYITSAIIFGALGIITVIASSEGGKGSGLLNWLSWLLFAPAFTLLYLAFEGFGIAGAYALWAAGVSLICVVQGVRWGDRLAMRQFVLIGFVLIGLTIFGLGGS